jgi:hypothetical protein
MSQSKRNPIDIDRDSDPAWKGLCRMGGVSALLQLVCVLVTPIVVFTVGAEPGTAGEYFTLLQNNRLLGLVRMDFPSMISVALYSLTLFGLYAALWRKHGAYMALATALGFAGIVLWLGTHSAFSMLSLSDQYAAATTDLQRSQLLAAGQAVIASDMWHSTGAVMGGIFMQSALTIMSILMLRDNVFSKATAWVGILTHGLDLAHVLFMIFAPMIGVYLIIAASPLYPIWFILVARRLFQLSMERARTPVPNEAG